MPATGSQVVPVTNPTPNCRKASPEFTRSMRPIARIRPAMVTAAMPVDVRNSRSALDPDRPVKRRVGRPGAPGTVIDASGCSDARMLGMGGARGRRGPSSATTPARGRIGLRPDRRGAGRDGVKLVDRLLLDGRRERRVPEAGLVRLSVGQRPVGEGDEGLALLRVLLVEIGEEVGVGRDRVGGGSYPVDDRCLAEV